MTVITTLKGKGSLLAGEEHLTNVTYEIQVRREHNLFGADVYLLGDNLSATFNKENIQLVISTGEKASIILTQTTLGSRGEYALFVVNGAIPGMQAA
jgi:hypothetical protein